LRRFDLVISTSHCVAKGVRTGPLQRHVSYIHTPMRYLWDQLPQYARLGRMAPVLGPALGFGALPLRSWDRYQARRPNVLLCNSGFVAARIRQYWGREATVVYPPVDTDFFVPPPQSATRRGLLVVGALVPYKRVELAVIAATRHQAELTVVGDGPERARLQRLAGPSVVFRPEVSREALREAYQNAAALLQPCVEDFGIATVEAISCGCPVLAYAKGGALETVNDGETGLLFDELTPQGLWRGVLRLRLWAERGRFCAERMHALARRFGVERFRAQIVASLAPAHGDCSLMPSPA
jgi:hypothetical protein